MLNQGQEMTPLEALWTLDPVSRHEIHGSLEGPLEALWEAVEKHRALQSQPFTAAQTMQAQEAIWIALRRLDKRAEETIKFFTEPRP